MKKIYGDCTQILPTLEKVDCIITDPPYNIGWKYSDRFHDHRKDYHTWCLDWALICMARLKDGGTLCIINYPENNNLLHAKMDGLGWDLHQQLIWHYPTNIGMTKKRYTMSYRTILVFCKGKQKTFHQQQGKYRNPKDKRVAQRILSGHAPPQYDVLTFNLCKNVSKSKKNIGVNQLPEALCDFLIQSYSNPGDTVLDPFSGNDTVPLRADALGRNGIGIDLNNYQEKR